MTHGSMTLSSLNNLQASLGRLAQSQEQLTTGKRINRASDDPTDAARAMRTRSSLADHEQYARNGADGATWLNLTDSRLQSMNDSLRRVHELGLIGGTDTNVGAAREALAVEVEQLRDKLLTEANATYLGRPIFGGITSGDKAFADDGTFVGTSGDVQRTVADGVDVVINSDGQALFGSGATSMFAELDALANAIRAGDKVAIKAGIDQVAVRSGKVVDELSSVGTRTNRVEAAVVAAKDSVLALNSSVSELENVELAEAMMQVQMHQVSYQAALAGTSKVIQPSLMDFLR
ncbi:flagellar hook-associated protein FlgL [Aeromicrobium massiliense]|uniref:flagellar hook-associated protein FlgL n=1 Tax=Aeromicrobium massiliense TaxID=1464554 RepID=UPI00155A28BE|nr:flagellar hook-associated protein FlgL [Aeromicrobium massiliense]